VNASNELAGKVAIVTGAGRNIGRAIALQLAQAGASVVVNARSNKAEADAVVRDIEAAGGKAVAVIGDVADAKTAKSLADAALKQFGRIDILVNNAALRRENSIEQMDFAEWQLVLTKGSQEDANVVWNAIKGKSLQFQALLLKASATSLDLAASLDDIDAKKKDVQLTMRADIPAKLLAGLKEGTQIQVAGTPDSYTPDPFVITMIDGGLLKAATPTPAPKKPAPTTRRPAAHH